MGVVITVRVIRKQFLSQNFSKRQEIHYLKRKWQTLRQTLSQFLSKKWSRVRDWDQNHNHF